LQKQQHADDTAGKIKIDNSAVDLKTMPSVIGTTVGGQSEAAVAIKADFEDEKQDKKCKDSSRGSGLDAKRVRRMLSDTQELPKTGDSIIEAKKQSALIPPPNSVFVVAGTSIYSDNKNLGSVVNSIWYMP
jgi:beta-N-acetylglucosaminidase